MTTVLNIPFKRPLYPPSYIGERTKDGQDIIAVKRMVSRLGLWPWGQFDDSYYEGFSKGQKNRLGRPIKGREGVAGLQRKLNIKATGYYGKATHLASTNLRIPTGLPHAREFAWDQTAINLYKKFDDTSPSESLVNDIFGWWDYLVAREPSVHYDQGRPITIISRGDKPPEMPISDDCSGTLIGCAWLAGAKSPDVSFQYSGYGNTSSLVAGGIHISESEIAAYCKNYYVAAFYGPSKWDTHHVVAVRNPTKIYSHGREAGPEVIYNNLHYHFYPLVAIRAYPVI